MSIQHWIGEKLQQTGRKIAPQPDAAKRWEPVLKALSDAKAPLKTHARDMAQAVRGLPEEELAFDLRVFGEQLEDLCREASDLHERAETALRDAGGAS